MTGPDSGRSGTRKSYHTVTDPRQARLLSEPRFQAAFRQFLAREASATAAARELGLDLDAMLYRVRLLLGAGLLEVVRHQKRNGRPIKVYRSVHDEYFVPYDVTPFADLQERLWLQAEAELRQRVAIQARRLRASGASGQRLYRDEHGDTWSVSADEPGQLLDWLAPSRPAAIDYWTDMQLTEAQGRELQRLLFETLQRFTLAGAQDHTPTKRYRLNVALLPLDE